MRLPVSAEPFDVEFPGWLARVTVISTITAYSTFQLRELRRFQIAKQCNLSRQLLLFRR